MKWKRPPHDHTVGALYKAPCLRPLCCHWATPPLCLRSWRRESASHPPVPLPTAVVLCFPGRPWGPWPPLTSRCRRSSTLSPAATTALSTTTMASSCRTPTDGKYFSPDFCRLVVTFSSPFLEELYVRLRLVLLLALLL